MGPDGEVVELDPDAVLTFTGTASLGGLVVDLKLEGVDAERIGEPFFAIVFTRKDSQDAQSPRGSVAFVPSGVNMLDILTSIEGFKQMQIARMQAGVGGIPKDISHEGETE